MDLITVIVPIYNVEKYLVRCVSSIQQQTYSNLEIVLVDDGSPDGCPEICEQLKNADSRIKVIHKKNGGLGLARNSGLEVASGEYVTFVDSDDWISETHIENLYDCLLKNSADAVIGSYTESSASGVETPHDISLKEGVYEGDSILNEIVLPLIGPDLSYPKDVQINSSCCMNLYRMSVIKNNNIKFPSEKVAVAEDLFFNVDFFMFSQKIVALNQKGYYYYENNLSISRKYNPKRFERTLNFYYKLHEQAASHKLTDKISYRIDRSFLMKTRITIKHIVNSDMHHREKIKNIKLVLKNELVKQVLNTYPVETVGFGMRLLVKLMRKENAFGALCMIKFREMIR